MGKLVGLVLVVVLALGAVPARADATTAPHTALIYGDSLVWESARFIKADMPSTLWARYVFAVPNTAPCDWLQRLPKDVAKYHPTAVTIVTEGNSDDACMEDANGVMLPLDSPAYLAKYRADLTQFFSLTTGSHVTFLEGAPMGCPNCSSWNAAVGDVFGIAQDLALGYPNVTVSNVANVAVSNGGVYAQTLPCSTAEAKSTRDGCVSGQIDVRTVSGTQAGIHLCPIGLNPWPAAHPCATFTAGKWVTVYSGGEVRYGSAIATATMGV